jgi:ureidoglycolate dehydrogenase (NAD+)
MSAATPANAISIESLKSFCIEALSRVGMSAEDAETTANALVTTDAMGVFTHGTKALAGYLNKLKGGGYRVTGKPKIERQGPGWAIIDGDSALGQVGSAFAMRTAMEKARSVGIAYVGLRNTGHIGAAGYYTATAARAGFIGMVTGNDIPSVAAPGSSGAVLGSNPIAYGIPVGNRDPIVLDMATAAVAGGKIYAAMQRGEAIPSSWLIDLEGKPTSDGTLYPDRAALAPMAGHKGYGFGLWCEILSAILPGGNMTWQVGSWIFDDPSLPSHHNASFIAIDVAAMAPPEQFEQRLQRLIDEIHATKTATGVERVLLPGEREWALHKKAQTAGIILPPDVIEKVILAASHAGIECPREFQK